MDKKNKALFVGLNTVDIQFLVSKYPAANTKTKAGRNEICAGGPATNAAITYSHLGGSAYLLSPMGQHSLSGFIKDDITKHNVHFIDPIENLNSKPIFASIITTETTGDRTIFSYMPDNDNKEHKYNLPELSDFKIALFDGFYLEIAIPLARNLKAAGVTTVLDGGSWKNGIEDLLPFIDIAICSNDFRPKNVEHKNELTGLLNSYGIEKLAVTNGSQAIFFSSASETGKIEIPVIDCIDTLGAGDIFHGAFCYYYSKGESFSNALKFASNVASFSCKYFGTRDWLKDFVV